MSTRIDYLKIRDVKAPSRNTNDDAGVDWYIPICRKEIGEDLQLQYTESSEQFLKDLKAKNADRNLKIIEPEGVNERLKIWIPIGERVLIPSGLKVKIHRSLLQRFVNWIFGIGDALNAENKSGVANKKGLVIGSKVVDYGYRGEVHLSVINTSNEDILIESGEKLVQFIHYPIFLSRYNRVFEDEYKKYEKTERSSGGFGSSGSF